MVMRSTTFKNKEIQRVIDTLTRAIAQHRIPPGMRLVEAQIVESLDANRNHVQAALQRLALQRIVTIEANRGARVSKPSAQEAREVFAARRAIERAIIEALTPEKISVNQARIHDHIQNERRAIETRDRRSIVRELSNFHRLLADVSGNAVLKDIFDNLMLRSSIIVALYQRNDEPSCQHDEHTNILQAIEKNDQETAVSLMIDHLNHLEHELALDDEDTPEIQLADVLRTI
jgi:DNA-binding GntR family transcriptional regulator